MRPLVLRHYHLLLAFMLAMTSLLVPHIARGQEESDQAYQEAVEHVMMGRWEQGRVALRQFLGDYPRSEWTDDARYWICLATDRLEDPPEEALRCYRQLVNQHPESRFVNDAESRIVSLARTLFQQGRSEYSAVLLKYSNSTDKKTALLALRTLPELGPSKALPALRDFYETADSVDVRKFVPRTLSRLSGTEATRFLIEIAQNDPAVEIRRTALAVLDQRSDPMVGPAVRKIVDTETSTAVREIGLRTLGQLGDDSNADFLADYALRDSSRSLAESAMFGLQQIDTPRSYEALARVAEESQIPIIKASSIQSLVQSGNERYAELIENIGLKTDHPQVQEAAMQGLARLLDKEAIPLIEKLFRSAQTERAQFVAISTIADLARRHSLPTSTRELLYEVAVGRYPPSVSTSAVRGLTPERPYPTDTLSQIVRRARAPQVAKTALQYLAPPSPDPEGIAELERVLQSDLSTDLKMEAIRLLGQRHAVQAIPALEEITRSESSDQMRQEALRALAEIGTSEARRATDRILASTSFSEVPAPESERPKYEPCPFDEYGLPEGTRLVQDVKLTEPKERRTKATTVLVISDTSAITDLPINIVAGDLRHALTKQSGGAAVHEKTASLLDIRLDGLLIRRGDTETYQVGALIDAPGKDCKVRFEAILSPGSATENE